MPDDYVAPQEWSDREVWPRISSSEERVVVVTGSPGAGKSTYLSWLVGRLHDAGVPVVRHHYFLSLTDPTRFRTACGTAAEALLGQLRTSYAQLVAGTDSANPVAERLPQYLASAGLGRAGMSPLVVIVDGLDHVWRDTGSADELRRLFDLLLPIPEGVVLVIGTQAVDMALIPPNLREHCPRQRWLEVPPLSLSEVRKWIEYYTDELGLPGPEHSSEWMLDELAAAFNDTASGHPLILHYTLNAARETGVGLRPARVRALPRFEPNSPVASYYQRLWDNITPEGHQLLHLLAKFDWAWPRNGLIQCLATQGDIPRLEHAERSVRHVLGASRAGTTAFHESLRAFVRALPEHQAASEALRPRVIAWIETNAPEYWRWRHAWELRAEAGDNQTLISSATLDWCVQSLVAGRSRADIAGVVAASGWAALESGDLGKATERHYLDDYLHAAADATDVLGRLTWQALRACEPRNLNLELNLFASRRSKASVDEIVAASEVAFQAEKLDICRELFLGCADLWRTSAYHGNRADGSLALLEQRLPSLLAAILDDPAEGPFRRHLGSYDEEPRWCSSERYVRALAVHCIVGGPTQPQREELRFLANHPRGAPSEAADEIVRLGCREGFDPDRWINTPQARQSGLFRCHRSWVGRAKATTMDLPRALSFAESGDEPRREESKFVERARSYFFACLACAIEEREPPEPTGLRPSATEVSLFLSLLGELAEAGASAAVAEEGGGAAWWLGRLKAIEPFFLEVRGFENHLGHVRNRA
ncbi:ATP-binding protein [Nannocystis punicea]|uniref:ATP-binding protein n=1 Tax=Nannocystis punicea TaxID=2995304 RepID=A0ABY7GYI4_9BACT|nr:ATP-binding protein [Nannocystis poenicansa]WAS91940.1 ATP-binding protein [Nannocystis poenicansa]